MSDTPIPETQSVPATVDLEQSPELYRVVLQTLRFGFLLATALFAAGIVALAISGDDMAETVMPIEQIPGKLMDLEPMALIDLAFLALMLTPIATVLRLGLTFFRLGERRFALISGVVLAILIASAVIALLR